MRCRLVTVGVVVALAAVGAPTALAAPVIRLTGTSASGYKNLQLAAGTVIDASAYRITTSDRYRFILGGRSDLTLTGATGKNTLPDSTSWKKFHGSQAGVPHAAAAAPGQLLPQLRRRGDNEAHRS